MDYSGLMDFNGCFHLLGMSSSQLTNSIIFQRGRYTTNQFGNCLAIFHQKKVLEIKSTVEDDTRSSEYFV